MALRLADRLDVPLRERNGLLTAAGFAPMYAARPFDDPAMAQARNLIRSLLQAHEPWPALVVDRHWNLVLYNRAVPLLLEGASPSLLQPPVNALRLSLHPSVVAARIVNHSSWRAHVLGRLRHQIAASGDPALAELEAELADYPPPGGTAASIARHAADPALVVPLVIDSSAGRLSFSAARFAASASFQICR